MTEITLEEYVDKTRGDYYLGITKIMVNGKVAYELKGRYLNDLHKNSFSGTNGEDAIEHIENLLKIVDLIDLPNVNYERLRLAIFPISLVGDARKWFDEFKGLITIWVDLTVNFLENITTFSYSDEVTSTNKNVSDLEDEYPCEDNEIAEIFRIETNLFHFETPLCSAFNEFNYLLKIDIDLFTHDILGVKTYEEYREERAHELNNDLEEPWSENGVPYELVDHICEPLRFKNRKTKWPTYS
ncbi:hypothetical protein Tco_1008097 [Tanacetum coccineum]